MYQAQPTARPDVGQKIEYGYAINVDQVAECLARSIKATCGDGWIACFSGERAAYFFSCQPARHNRAKSRFDELTLCMIAGGSRNASSQFMRCCLRPEAGHRFLPRVYRATVRVASAQSALPSRTYICHARLKFACGLSKTHETARRLMRSIGWLRTSVDVAIRNDENNHRAVRQKPTVSAFVLRAEERAVRSRRLRGYDNRQLRRSTNLGDGLPRKGAAWRGRSSVDGR